MKSNYNQSAHEEKVFRMIPLGKHPNGSGDDYIKVFAGAALLGFAKSEAEAIQLFNECSI